MEEFSSIDNLIYFVLEECMDLKDHQDFQWSQQQTRIGELQEIWGKEEFIELYLYNNFDMQKILYLDILLKKHFDINIKSIRIRPNGTIVPETIYNFDDIEKMTSLVKFVYRMTEKLPKLPESLVLIAHTKSSDSKIKKHFLGYWTINSQNDDRLTRYEINGKFETKREALDAITNGDIIV